MVMFEHRSGRKARRRLPPVAATFARVGAVAAGFLVIVGLAVAGSAKFKVIQPAPALVADEVPAVDAEPQRATAPARMVDPDSVAPPEIDVAMLERIDPRAPLSELSGPLPPRPAQAPPDGIVYRPVAVESAKFEAKDLTLTIAGTASLPVDETCVDDGRVWACGLRARGATRQWLRGRALNCDFPDGALTGDQNLTCRLGKQDVGAWLVSMGWARATAGGPYVEAEAQARRHRMGMFGPAPDLTLPPLVDEPSSGPEATAGTAGKVDPT